MKYKVDFPIAVLMFFSIGSMLAVWANYAYPPPLCRTLLRRSKGSHGALVVTMDVEAVNGRRFDDVHIVTLTLKNTGNEPYSRDLRQPVFAIHIYNAGGALISRRSGRDEAHDLPIPIHLENGAEFTEIKIWDPALLESHDGTCRVLPPGRYYLKGVWLGQPMIGTGLISIDVE